MKIVHSAWSYRKNVCRCEICRNEHARLQREGNASRAQRLAADPTLAPHGEYSTYANWGCRCDACKAVAAVASLKKYERFRRPRRPAFGREWLQ